MTRTSEPTHGGYRPGLLSEVSTLDDLAHVAGVEPFLLELVRPTSNKCGHRDCPFNAVEGNASRCIMHSRTWFPRGAMRGNKLRGIDFLRPKDGDTSSCDCDLKICHDLGYCPIGYEYIPSNESIRAQVANTPNLFSDAKIKRILEGGMPKLRLFRWHFFPFHRETDPEGDADAERLNVVRLENGRPDMSARYRDLEGRKQYLYPPPLYPPDGDKGWYENEYKMRRFVHPHERWAERKARALPHWAMDMLALDKEEYDKKQDGNTIDTDEGCTAHHSSPAKSPASGHTSSPRKSASPTKSVAGTEREVKMWRDRALEEHSGRKREREELEAIIDYLKRQNAELKDNIVAKDKVIDELKQELKERDEKIAKLQTELKDAKKMKGASPLRYADLASGGLLAKRVGAYTYFNSFEQNEAFLEVINWADGSEGSFPAGDGLCEHLRSYSTVNWNERSCEVPPPSYDEERYAQYLRKSDAAKKTDMTYKDEWFVYNIFTHCGMTEAAVAGLFGIKSVSTVSNIIYAWANVLDDALSDGFPRPTRSQMLRAYPTRTLRCHPESGARIWLELDAFEVPAQTPDLPDGHSAVHSDYKAKSTIKFLGGTDPIGTCWSGSVSVGFPGAASDNLMTVKTEMLKEVPPGHLAETDKGFTVENDGVEYGVGISRPLKKISGQKQQSAEDTAKTQKTGNSRIIVENVNGEMKMSTRFLNAMVPVSMFGIVSTIVRVAYLLQNFNIPKTQHRPRPTTNNT